MKPRIVFWAIFLGLCGFYVGIPPFHYTSMDAHPDEPSSGASWESESAFRRGCCSSAFSVVNRNELVSGLGTKDQGQLTWTPSDSSSGKR